MPEWLDRYNAAAKEMNRIDAEAKAKGTLVGRYVKEPYADGHALYLITKESPRKVAIEVIRLGGDDWEIPYWGESATIDRAYAEANIARRDGWEKLWNERKKA